MLHIFHNDETFNLYLTYCILKEYINTFCILLISLFLTRNKQVLLYQETTKKIHFNKISVVHLIFIEHLKVVLFMMIVILLMSEKLATPGFLKAILKLK